MTPNRISSIDWWASPDHAILLRLTAAIAKGRQPFKAARKLADLGPYPFDQGFRLVPPFAAPGAAEFAQFLNTETQFSRFGDQL